MFDELSLFELIMRGGFTMIVLAIFSVASVAVILSRAWRFKGFKQELQEAYRELSGRIDGKGLQAAREYSENDSSALSLIFLSGYGHRRGGTDEILRAMELSARKAIASLERYVGVLGTIGSTAPFVGLFGTVLGIMRAFSALARAEGAGPSVVADGIAEALVATAGGLLVAVPAVIAYNYFVRAASRISVDLEAAANEFVAPINDGADKEEGA